MVIESHETSQKKVSGEQQAHNHFIKNPTTTTRGRGDSRAEISVFFQETATAPGEKRIDKKTLSGFALTHAWHAPQNAGFFVTAQGGLVVIYTQLKLNT